MIGRSLVCNDAMHLFMFWLFLLNMVCLGFVSTAKRFCNELKNTMMATTTASYATVPMSESMSQSHRDRFPLGQSTVNIMHRKVTVQLQQFIQECQGKPAVYVQGPRGVGKSFSLYEIVCRLTIDPTNRVIYIPDCAGWGSKRERASDYLLEIIISTFCNDPDIVTRCKCEDATQETVMLDLLTVILCFGLLVCRFVGLLVCWLYIVGYCFIDSLFFSTFRNIVNHMV
jgi:hypothetical protein